LSQIKLNPVNPRRISNQDMDRLVKSLNDFPEMMKLREIVVDETMTVLGASGVYAIFSRVDDRVYIGSAASIGKRIKEHRSDLRAGRHHSRHLQNFYNKHGLKSLGFAVLRETEKTKQAIIEAEQFFIDNMHPAFNMSPTAGSNLGARKSPEQRKALSEKRLSMNIHYDDDYKRRMSIALSGENNPMYGKSPNWGKKHKPETIQKMIESHHDVKGANNPKYGIPQSPGATEKANITRRKTMFAKGRCIKASKDGEVISIFRSAMEAAKVLEISFTSIYRAMEKRQGRCKGYVFSFTGGGDGISQVVNA
jgi:group I intron endonuclease